MDLKISMCKIHFQVLARTLHHTDFFSPVRLSLTPHNTDLISHRVERGKYYCGGEIKGLNVPKREFPCKSPLEVRELLPSG